MLQFIPEVVIKDHLKAKSLLSMRIENAFGYMNVPRHPVPDFLTPKDCWAYWREKGSPYNGDPLWGVIDFYLHPSRLQRIMEGQPLPFAANVDCDDMALWALYGLSKNWDAEMVTLVHEFVVKSHVICTVKTKNPKPGDKVDYIAIDTSGVHVLPDLEPETLRVHYGNIFEAKYDMAVKTMDPFCPF